MKELLKVYAPYSGELLGEVVVDTVDDIQHKLKRAVNCYNDRAGWMAPHLRISVLERLAAKISNAAHDYAMLIAQEGGKPIKDAIVEVGRAVVGIKAAIAALQDLSGGEVPMGLTQASEGRLSFTRYEPRGVVIAISAFNHPLNLLIHQVIPAIAIGAPILIKPALETPLTCKKLMDDLYEAGLDESWCTMIVCSNELAQHLVKDPRIAFLSFIGSAVVGWSLRAQLAPGVRCALEHGGNAPVIVDRDIDLEKIIPLLAKGAFYHAGQVCVSVQRIYAHSSIFRELIDALTHYLQSLRVGDPMVSDTDIGPLIRESDVYRIDLLVKQGIAAGAKCVAGGSVLENQCYAPTILMNVPENESIMQNEIFGPVVCINSFEDFDKAIQLANDSSYQFQAAIFSQNLNHVTKAIKLLEANTVLINDHTAFRVDWMPFAGGKKSGLGTGGIAYTMKDYCYEKLIVFN